MEVQFKVKANKGWGRSEIEQQHNGQHRKNIRLTDVWEKKRRASDG